MSQTVRPRMPKLMAVAVLATCLCLLVLAFVLSGSVAAPQAAHAASVLNVTLKPDKTYTSYDITGDGKADKIKIGCGGRPANSKVWVYVNGDSSYCYITHAAFSYGDEQAQYIRLSTGIALLRISSGMPDDGTYDPGCVLKWKSGKLASVLDLRQTSSWLGCSGNSKGCSLKPSGSNLAVDYFDMTPGLGGLKYKVTYSYSGGVLKASSTTSSVWLGSTKKVAASKSLQFYKNAGCTKRFFKMKKGQTGSIKKLSLTSNCCSLQVKTSAGKAGWIMIPQTSCATSPLFQQCYWAG